MEVGLAREHWLGYDECRRDLPLLWSGNGKSSVKS
jgi:hypothetical protein